MDRLSAAYRLGFELFVIEVTPPGVAADAFRAHVFRVEADDRLSLVRLTDGAAFEVTGPTAWEARLKLVARLEGYVGKRAFEAREIDPGAFARDGEWRLPP